MLSLNPLAKANKTGKQQFSMRYGELPEPSKGLPVLLKGISPENIYVSGLLVIDFNFYSRNTRIHARLVVVNVK